MSKRTIRLPMTALEDGRIGTARVRGMASGLGSSHNPSYMAPTVIVPGISSPIERMQQLGRLPRGRMNKTEAAYVVEQLEPELHAGLILWYRFEAIKLRLADKTFITIDFPVINAAGQLEFREVKGRWTDDARAKTKMAAEQFPFRFIAVQREGRHGWRCEDMTARSW
ncbi:hypothetical protein [Burkholderia anthina]|uniref:hypothetical protein n=1 Tax=Burkholderia anthina TaxID=179879 RepID=UPI001FC8C3A4|nr:hypothetical protein [Burkholderia anthina]